MCTRFAVSEAPVHAPRGVVVNPSAIAAVDGIGVGFVRRISAHLVQQCSREFLVVERLVSSMECRSCRDPFLIFCSKRNATPS